MPRKKNQDNIDKYNNVFPTLFREEARKRKMSQDTIAKALGISRQAISYYMNGTSLPDIESLEKISRLLEVSADYLLGISEYKSIDSDIAQASITTGLSEDAILALKQYITDGTYTKDGKTIVFPMSKAQNVLNIILGEAWSAMKDHPEIKVDWNNDESQDAPRSAYGLTVLDKISDYISSGHDAIAYIPYQIEDIYIKKVLGLDKKYYDIPEAERQKLLEKIQISLSNINAPFKTINAKDIYERISFDELTEELKSLRKRVIENEKKMD